MGPQRKIAGKITTALAVAVTFLLPAVRVGGQAESTQKPLMAEQYFKNVQVLRWHFGVKELMDTMGFFAASLGENCTFCHVEESSGDWSKYADDNANKLNCAQNDSDDERHQQKLFRRAPHVP